MISDPFDSWTSPGQVSGWEGAVGKGVRPLYSLLLLLAGGHHPEKTLESLC